MSILNTNDDPKVVLQQSEASLMAMSTLRGDMYRAEGKNNQDCVASFTAGKMMIDMVCDGLGGYADQNGEQAALMCCEEAEKLLNSFSQKGEPEEFFKELLRKTVTRYEQEGLGPNAGTTLLLMLTVNSKLSVFHLGDSRAMLFKPDGTFLIQTKDHKPADFMSRFKLTKYVYQTDPEELFSQTDEVTIELDQYPEGIVAILMSDGITDNLKTSIEKPECQTILSQLIREHQHAESLCAAIMKTANERMALKGTPQGEQLDVKPDNSTCLVRWFSKKNM